MKYTEHLPVVVIVVVLRHTVRYLFSPEPLLDFCMHYMHDYHTSPHFHRFLLFYLAKIGENGG